MKEQKRVKGPRGFFLMMLYVLGSQVVQIDYTENVDKRCCTECSSSLISHFDVALYYLSEDKLNKRLTMR